MRGLKFRVWTDCCKKMSVQENREKLIKDICENDYVKGIFIPSRCKRTFI